MGRVPMPMGSGIREPIDCDSLSQLDYLSYRELHYRTYT
jgi:hypothetical protein